jgi:hypothetical protein
MSKDAKVGLLTLISANEPRFRLLATFDTDGEVLQVLVRFIGVSYSFSDRFGGL